MIILKLKNNHISRYHGNIKILIDEDFVIIDSNFTQDKGEFTWDSHTWDAYYSEDVVSIEGIEK